MIFQVADTKEKRKKGIFGKAGGDKEVLKFLCIKLRLDQATTLFPMLRTQLLFC